MPFPLFDRSKLNILPLADRISDINISIVKDFDTQVMPFDNPKMDLLCDDILAARRRKAEVIMMYGAHVIRAGNAKLMIEMMEKGLITHFATNGAGSIHDFEFALRGETCESVAKYISEGQFGLWKESGMVNDAIAEGVKLGMGAGEAIGRYIWENNFKYRDSSLLANAYKNHIPATVHIGIGNDIIHEHPNCDGALLGQASYTDFLIYAKTIENLEGGVFLNFGSAVAGPEVYLKCLAMARNVAHQEGRKITDITTAVFDLLPIEGEDFNSTPPKSDPRYYFRPWKTILTRTVADGGKSYYMQGSHDITVPAMAHRLLSKI
jgi:hypothetical protein